MKTFGMSNRCDGFTLVKLHQMPRNQYLRQGLIVLPEICLKHVFPLSGINPLMVKPFRLTNLANGGGGGGGGTGGFQVMM